MTYSWAEAIMKSKKPLVMGIAGSAGLLVVYFLILTLANSFAHAIEQFYLMWYWIVALVVGFGIQIGLYFHIRAGLREQAASGAKKEIAASGGVSTGSMIACCLHHVADVLPIIGLSAAALFLLQYQVVFIILGILSNIVGITMMLNIMQKHELRSFRYNMHTVRNRIFYISVILFFAVFLITMFAGPTVVISGINSGDQSIALPTITNDGNGVSVDVTPLEFSPGNPVIFDIGINTHQGSLNFDVDKIATLEDSFGNTYQATGWDGSPSGGHHRSGRLDFPAINSDSASMRLVLRDIYDVPERVFEWELGG